MSSEFRPVLFSLIREEGLSFKTLRKEILSGTVVGIVALPLAIAFAIASGVSPEKGLISAIIGGFVISAFGGSRVQIGGPTGAFIVVIYGIIERYGLDGLVVSTLLAGLIIIAMGILRFGNYLKFIPYPLVVGFTSGIALIIFSSQVNDFLGLGINNLPSGFIEKWVVYSGNFSHINYFALGTSLFTLVVTRYFHRISRKLPGAIVALFLSTLVVQLFHLPVETIESRFGEIPNSFSLPEFPDVNYEMLKSLIQPAFAIAILGSIESLLSAVVADGMTGSRHRSNMELIAQGGANIFSALFGGIPVTGAIARTATNVRNGGRTPVSGIVHAITLLLIMLFLAPYAKLIPLASLAGVLTVVAYNMSEWKQFRSLLRSRGLDVLILLTTFFLTVIFDLIIAIEIGIVLSSFLFMKRMSESISVKDVTEETERKEVLFQEELGVSSGDILLYEINGPLFFGAAQQFQDSLSSTNVKPKIVILRMRYVPFIDATGYQRMKEIIRNFKANGIKVALSGVSENLRNDFEKNDLYRYIPREMVFSHIQAALSYCMSLIAKK